MVEVMKIVSTSFKRSHARTAALSASDPEVGHYQPMPPPETLGHSWASLGQSFMGSLLLSPGPGADKVLFVPSKSLFPQSCGSSVIKSHWPSKSNSLEILSPFARYPGWGICCGP